MLKFVRRQAALRRALTGVVAALGLGGLAASSAQGAQPGAESFSQPLAEAQLTRHAGHGETAYRSRVIDAPGRFDLAGLSGELRHYEIRARTRGGEWSDWGETANGDPVWFGNDAEQLQLRAHDWRPEGRIAYVDVETSQAATSAPRGDAGMPSVVSRREWGADDCKPRRQPDYGKVKAAVVHHTVSVNTYSESEAPGLVLGICKFHKRGNGWDDIGYNALVDRFGNIYEGRAGGLGRAVVGAQAQGVNSQTTGVAALGTHTDTPVSRAGLNGIVRWLAWKLPEHGVPAKGKTTLTSAGGAAARYPEGERFRAPRIMGHRVPNTTSCPGDALYGKLGTIRKKVARRTGDGSGGDGGSDGGGGIGR
jgi:hypothetical protein